MSDRIFIVYDARAAGGSTDDAEVLCSASSLPGVVYSYRDDGQNLVDESHEFTHPDCVAAILTIESRRGLS